MGVLAEEFSNTIDSVKVKSVGDKEVVVDVYVTSTDASVKPQLSSRKYKDDKYVIDLMQVTQDGNVSRDTSASSGLLESKDIKVGKLPGGMARVLIDLDDPDLKVKEVKYHVVSAKKKVDKPVVKPEETTVKEPDEKPASETKVATAPKTEPVKRTEPKPDPPVLKPKADVPKESTVKPEPKPVEKSPEEPKATKPVTGPQIIHKTDKPAQVEPEKVVNKPQTEPIKKVETVVSKPVQTIETNTEAKPEPKVVKPEIKPVVEDKTKTVPKIEDKQTVNTVTETLPEEKLIAQVPEVEHKQPDEKVINPVDPEQTPVNFADNATEGDMRVVDVKKDDFNILGMLFSIVGPLSIVIGLIIVVVLLINVFYKGGDTMGLKAISNMGGNRFKIISSTSLGQGKSIHLVEIKGKQLVIGCTNNSINILTEFGDFDYFVEEQKQPDIEETVSPKYPGYKRSKPPIGSFSDLYKEYTSKVDDQDFEDEY